MFLEVEPTAPLALPGSQAVHEIDATFSAYVPAAQIVQEVEPLIELKNPDLHGSQSDSYLAPAREPAVPAGHK